MRVPRVVSVRDVVRRPGLVTGRRNAQPTAVDQSTHKPARSEDDTHGPGGSRGYSLFQDVSQDAGVKGLPRSNECQIRSTLDDGNWAKFDALLADPGHVTRVNNIGDVLIGLWGLFHYQLGRRHSDGDSFLLQRC